MFYAYWIIAICKSSQFLSTDVALLMASCFGEGVVKDQIRYADVIGLVGSIGLTG